MLPTSWGEWSALVGILATIAGLLFWVARYLHHDITKRIDDNRETISGKVEESIRRLSDIEAWQRYMEDDHLPKTYARRDLVDQQFREARESGARVELLVKETKAELIAGMATVKADLRESMHGLRNDLLVIFKNDAKDR